MQALEADFEKHVAEMEAVNVRVEELQDMPDIPRTNMIELNQRFKNVFTTFEKYQRPEEKGKAGKRMFLPEFCT